MGAGRLTALPQQLRGRGARNNDKGRYEKNRISFFDDGWETLADLPPLKTTIFEEQPKTIIARNQSPDISFDRSINPYRGCEHGCVYCYARPTHAYMGLSPGLDFESKLFVKPTRRSFCGPNCRHQLCTAHHCAGDQYGSLSADRADATGSRGISSRCCREFNHPVGIVTKSALVVRDLDILDADGGARTGEGRHFGHDA